MSTALLQREAKTEGPVKPHHPWWLVATEFVVLFVAAVLFLELFLDICGIGKQEFVRPDPELGCVHILGKPVTWRLEGFSQGKLNSLGLRDVEHSVAKPEGITRMAVLGDSQSEGLQVPMENIYCRLLDSKMNSGEQKFEVINFACSSYSTAQQLLYFKKEVAAFKPDIAMLLFVPGNAPRNVRDLSARVEEPRPYFYLDAAGKLQLDRSVLEAQREKLEPSAVLDFLRANSRIYGVMAQTDLALGINEKLYRKLRSTSGKISNWFKPRSQGSVAAVYPQQDYWQVTRALLKELNVECKKNGVRFIVTEFPNMLDDPKMAKQIQDLKRDSLQAGYGFLDLTPAFRSHRDPKSLFLAVHFSKAGHALIADELEKYLRNSANK